MRASGYVAGGLSGALTGKANHSVIHSAAIRGAAKWKS
jgi:hypothetical protein